MTGNRILVLAGGFCGVAGVALSAAAAHGEGVNTGTAASFLLAHAPAFLAVGLISSGKHLRIGALVLLAGLLVFAGDLLMRDFAGTRLFPFAAPAGGILLIAGWAGIGLSALVPAREQE